MKIRILAGNYERQAMLLSRKISERIDLEESDGGLLIELSVDNAHGPAESYEIVCEGQLVRVIGTDELGLSHGIGKLLHSAVWSEQEFTPAPPAGLQTPHATFRAMYFSVHNYNWYHTATPEELELYLEDMVLWGYNAIHCIVPVMNIAYIDDEIFNASVEKARRLYLLARKLGMKTSFGVNPNQGIKSTPHEMDADQRIIPWKGGRNLCPAKPGTVAHLRTIWRAKLEQFLDIGLDFIHTWPYDEGGCCCPDCWPWGARGYGDISNAFHEEAVKYYPNAKFILSTWCFDTLGEKNGEYEGLYARLRTDLSWVDYLMVDSHGEYAEYVLRHDLIKPIVNFPEISMWGLYPWGGFGANPLPNRFQRIWNSSRRVLSGGMPYSEGFYEDIHKILFAGYYWNPEWDWRDILSEYVAYEYSCEVIPQVLEVMELIEQNHVAGDDATPIDLDAAYRARDLAQEVDAMLSDRAKRAWRWRILYIRTLLDVKRYEFYCARNMGGEDDRWTLRRRSAKFLEHDEEAQVLMWELCELYHTVDYNGENRWTHPPVNGGDVTDTLRVQLKEVDG